MTIEVIFEDENFIVVNKEPQVLSVPSRIGKNDKRRILGIELQDFLNKKIFPVHRLDFEVSGLILYAKNIKASILANGWFEKKIIYKTYHALTTTIEDQEKWLSVFPQSWKSLLVRGKKRTFQAEYGKESITHVISATVERNQNTIRWQLQPITGRSHQLRYELSSRGFKILGDELYGYEKTIHPNWLIKGIALECIGLEFASGVENKPFQLLQLPRFRF